MEILFVTATLAEAIGAGLVPSEVLVERGELTPLDLPGINGTLLVTGIGSPATAFHLGKFLADKTYKLAINLGIAGGFNQQFPPGTVVGVQRDYFADLGAEDQEDFHNVFTLGFEDLNTQPFQDGWIIPMLPPCLPQVSLVDAITVNKVHGAEQSIRKIVALYPNAIIETMEGAGFYYACTLSGQPSFQLRAVSNFVEPRNRADWQIAAAMSALKKVIHEWLEQLRAV